MSNRQILSVFFGLLAVTSIAVFIVLFQSSEARKATRVAESIRKEQIAEEAGYRAFSRNDLKNQHDHFANSDRWLIGWERGRARKHLEIAEADRLVAIEAAKIKAKADSDAKAEADRANKVRLANKHEKTKSIQAAASRDSEREAEAWIAAREFVTAGLKSPSTASFGWQQQNVTQIKSFPNGYLAGGWVDSQNSFGATIRTRFVCGVQKTLGGWKLVYLNFDE